MDETNLLSLIRYTNCQITTKFATVLFCKKKLQLNRPNATGIYYSYIVRSDQTSCTVCFACIKHACRTRKHSELDPGL
jgi:hypothetical protein